MARRDWIQGLDVWSEEDEENLTGYMAFLERNREAVGALGDCGKGEIEIVADKRAARSCVLEVQIKITFISLPLFPQGSQ